MVSIIINNQELFANDPELFKDKINFIFEPMVDFRRVGASVMGKNIILQLQNYKGFNLFNHLKHHCLIHIFNVGAMGRSKNCYYFS